MKFLSSLCGVFLLSSLAAAQPTAPRAEPLTVQRLAELLDEVIDTADFQQPMNLKEALGLLRQRFARLGTELPLQMDVKSFTEENPDAPNIYDTQIQFPEFPRRMQLGAA